MTNRFSITLTSLGALVALFTFTGCGSTEVAQKDTEPTYMGVGIEDSKTWNPKVAPEGDKIEQVVKFAVSLSEQGRHEQAAEIFEDAASQVKSKRNELNIQLYLSAANEYLKAGDMAGFSRTLTAAEKVADRYQRAAWDESTQRLFELRDTYHPAPVKGSASELMESAYAPVASPDEQTVAFSRSASSQG